MKLESISPLTTNSSSELFVFYGKTEDYVEELLASFYLLCRKEDYSHYPEEINEIKTPEQLVDNLEFFVDERDFQVYNLDPKLKELIKEGWNHYSYIDLEGYSKKDIIELLKLDKLTYPITLCYLDRWKTKLLDEMTKLADRRMPE